MTKSNTALELKLEGFLDTYAESLQALMADLNEAGISHYSSGCGVKNVTFNIFPASAYVAELLEMIKLKRLHKNKMRWGFRDASSKSSYNPGNEFLQYLRRWSLFAEQVMKNEGSTVRGVAAARAKLTMGDLAERLSRDSLPAVKATMKSVPRTSDFLRMMQEIGLTLEQEENRDKAHRTNHDRQSEQEKYREALAAAQGTRPDRISEEPTGDFQVA